MTKERQEKNTLNILKTINFKTMIKVILAPRENINRKETTGECYMSKNGIHFYLIREHDVLHVGEKVINTLFDNHITATGDEYIKITRTEFNEKLNNTIFSMEFYSDEYKS